VGAHAPVFAIAFERDEFIEQTRDLTTESIAIANFHDTEMCVVQRPSAYKNLPTSTIAMMVFQVVPGSHRGLN
jgi:hypothetical protein